MKESIPMEQQVASGCSQAVVEGEITLPGGLREEARVLHAGGMAVISSVETMQDRAAISGKVVFRTLYTQGDPEKVQAIEATAEFTHMMDLPGTQPRMLCQAEIWVEHVDAHAANGRLSQRAVVRVCARVLSPQPVETLTGIKGVAGLELCTRQLTLCRTVAAGDEETLLREEFALPQGLQVRETLCADAAVQVEEVTGGVGRAGVCGTVQLEVYHASELPGKPLVVTRHVIPFSQTVELSGEDGEMLHAQALVKDVAVASQENAEGERTLRAEVLLGLQASAHRQEQVTLLQDAYTTQGDALQFQKQTVRVRQGDAAGQSAESGKAMLMLPEGSPAVRTVLCAFATPILTSREQIGGRLNAEGMLEITLLYMTDDSAVPVAVYQEEPFRVTFAVKTEPDDFLHIQAAEIDASAITSDRVEMKYIMRLTISGTRTTQAELVTDVETTPAEEPDAAMILCFAQQGETLWDIARRYRMPMAFIKELNPELAAEPRPGQGVVVWHRRVEE